MILKNVKNSIKFAKVQNFKKIYQKTLKIFLKFGKAQNGLKFKKIKISQLRLRLYSHSAIKKKIL